MTDTATSRLGARQQSQGSNTNTWGDDKLNEALRLIDRAMHGVESLAMTGDTTLSWSNYVATNTGQVAFLTLTGSLSAAAALIVPSVQWCWRGISNTTGQTITVRTSAGTGVTIPNGRTISIKCDGSDCSYAGQNYLGADVTETNARDLMDKSAVETAIASAALPATSGTVLVSSSDTTAGYVGAKVNVTGSGAASVTPSTTNPGANEVKTFAISVGSLGLTDGGVQLASFTAVAGNAYVCPAGGTITLPSASGTRSKIAVAIGGAGATTLSGKINGAATFAVDGNQTLLLTDYDSTQGWI